MNESGFKKIYLLRHGAIEGVSAKTYIGRLDMPLSEQGRAQARSWSRYFRNRYSGPVVTGGLQRTLETARIIARDEVGRILIDDNFREIALGDWEGEPMEKIRGLFPEQWELRGKNLKGFRPPGGESFDDLARRVMPAFERLVENMGAEAMLVAHAGVNRVILAYAMGVDLNRVFQIPQDHAALNVIETAKNERRVVLLNAAPPKSVPGPGDAD